MSSSNKPNLRCGVQNMFLVALKGRQIHSFDRRQPLNEIQFFGVFHNNYYRGRIAVVVGENAIRIVEMAIAKPTQSKLFDYLKLHWKTLIFHKNYKWSCKDLKPMLKPDGFKLRSVIFDMDVSLWAEDRFLPSKQWKFDIEAYKHTMITTCNMRGCSRKNRKTNSRSDNKKSHNLYICAGCERVRYCCRKHQKRDWKMHHQYICVWKLKIHK